MRPAQGRAFGSFLLRLGRPPALACDRRLHQMLRGDCAADWPALLPGQPRVPLLSLQSALDGNERTFPFASPGHDAGVDAISQVALSTPLSSRHVFRLF